MHDEVPPSPEFLKNTSGEAVSGCDMELPEGFIDAVLRLSKPEIPGDTRCLDQEMSERSDIAVLLVEFAYSPDELVVMRRGALAIIAAEEQLAAEAQKAGTVEVGDDTNNVAPMRSRDGSGQGHPTSVTPAVVVR